MKKTLFNFLIILGLSGCSSLWYGTSNQPEPVERPKVNNPTVTSKVLWKANLGDGVDDLHLALTPIGGENNIFAISVDGKFYRFSTATGERQLRINLENEITGGLSAAGYVVVAGAKNGDLLALSPEDGHIIWRSPLPSTLLAPVTASDTMIIAKTIDGTITALDVQDGSVIWQHVSSVPQFQLVGSSSAIIGGGVVMSLDHSGYLTVLTEDTGLPILENRVAIGTSGHEIGNMVDQIATPKINGDILFGAAYQNSIFGINLRTGNVVWQNDQVNTAIDFTIDNASLYAITPDDKVVSLSQKDGQIQWTNAQFIGRKLSPPVLMQGQLGILDNEGYLYWLDSQTGSVLGSTRIGGSGSYSPALVLNDRIVWQLNNGRLVVVQPQYQ